MPQRRALRAVSAGRGAWPAARDETRRDPMAFSPHDERFMDLALALGRRGLGNAWPNPAVGAVVVDAAGDAPVIVGRGWTQPGGRPHAEVEALARAGTRARGATLYVTLEPCSHHGQTPPCADAIIAAGIARVVSADRGSQSGGGGGGPCAAARPRHRGRGRPARSGGQGRPCRPFPPGAGRASPCDLEARGLGRRQGGARRPQARGDHGGAARGRGCISCAP